jgi:CO dehydrogenase/acetyl-CoA synthase beta subunit
MNIILIFFLSNNAKSVRINGGINSVILINDLIKKKIKRHIIHELSSKVALKSSSL